MGVDEREKNDQHCQHLLDRLVCALGLEFKPATNDIEDGWYVWRNSPDWPVSEYAVFEIADGSMCVPEPADSYGTVDEMREVDPFGELAGPILGR